MINEIDHIEKEGVVIFVKYNILKQECFYYFNKLQSLKDIYLLEEYLLKKAHKVDLMYEDYSSGNLELKMIRTYEDYLRIPKTSQGIFIIAESYIYLDKLTRNWSCKHCMTKNNQKDLICKYCNHFITLSGQVRQINYSPFHKD